MSWDIVIIVLMLLLSAFFTGMEIAYATSNKIHIEIEKQQDGFLARILSKLTAKPSKFITAMLIGNSMALVIYGFKMSEVLVSGFESLALRNTWANYLITEAGILIQTVIAALIILITAKFLPRIFFQIYANSLLKILALPAYLFYGLFSGLSGGIIWISNLVLKVLFKTEGNQIQYAFTKVELGNYIIEQMKSVEEDKDLDTEIQIFQNALEFSEVKAREIMVPRTEIEAVELSETIKNISLLFTNTGYSKILVYKDTIDDILGYVHSFDLFVKPKTIKSILKPVEFVPETMLIKDTLNVLIKKRRSIAVVLDEYGGTSGILTVEDIVEELFGEIEDEHDSDDLIEKKIAENHFKLSARLEVDYINQNLKLNLPESENYETLGGLIVSHIKEIPEPNKIVQIDNLQFTILEVSDTKIDLVELKILEKD
ncbi:MAG TPA: hemolysin family protein [Flavobacteriaceae bacterium]|nr:hemolysin family protein [Flavobacteriaceae bacterium]